MSAESLPLGRLVSAPMNTAVRTKSAGRLLLADRRQTVTTRRLRTLGDQVARNTASPSSVVAACPAGAPRSGHDLPLIVALARISLAVALREEATLTADGRRTAHGVSSRDDRAGTSEGHS